LKAVEDGLGISGDSEIYGRFTMRTGANVDYELAYDSKNRVLLITMGRTVTKASAAAAQTAVQRFMEARGPYSIIADLSAIEEEDVPGYFVRSLAGAPSAIASGYWLILVAPQTQIYGLSRMFHLWRDEAANYKIVRTLEEGYALLAVKAEDFQVIGSLAEKAGGSAP
jgi:hypothetical protein